MASETASPPRGSARVPGLCVGGDERLARLVGQGSDRAFAVLYERHHQALYRYCRALVHNDVDAQDALQTTFMRALSALRRGQRDAPLRPWLFRIAHNESISLLRRRRPVDELSETMESPAMSVEQVAGERERLEQLLADLRELPERQRGALVMRELSGLSHDEIAGALGISPGAARQTVLEARRSLAEFAEGRAFDCREVQQIISDADGRALRARRVRAHLRGCPRCADFAGSIPERRSRLRAVAPALPALASVQLLGRITKAGASSGGGSSGVLAGATGKAIGVALSTKGLALGAAVVAAAGLGATGALVHTGRVADRSGRGAALQALGVPSAGAGAHGEPQSHARATPSRQLLAGRGTTVATTRAKGQRKVRGGRIAGAAGTRGGRQGFAAAPAAPGPSSAAGAARAGTAGAGFARAGSAVQGTASSIARRSAGARPSRPAGAFTGSAAASHRPSSAGGSAPGTHRAGRTAPSREGATTGASSRPSSAPTPAGTAAAPTAAPAVAGAPAGTATPPAVSGGRGGVQAPTQASPTSRSHST